MMVPPFFAVQKQKLNGVVTLVTTDYMLDPLDIDPTADFRVFADTLTIPPGTFSLPGKNLTIYARNLVCPAGAAAVIDTSGAGFTAPVCWRRAGNIPERHDLLVRGLTMNTGETVFDYRINPRAQIDWRKIDYATMTIVP